MKIKLNGRPKGTTARCEDHVMEINAKNDQDAWTYIHAEYEHVVWARHEDETPLDRKGQEPWA